MVMAPDRDEVSTLNAEAVERVHRYARAVVAGEIVVGRLVRRACERHLRDLETAAGRGLRFDEQRAGRAIRFFPMAFRHYKGEWGPLPGVRAQGLPIELEDWQAFLVGSLFGWLRRDTTKPEDHPRAWVRRFRRFYLEVAKKNGKSLLAAGLANILTFFDGEPGAEGYFAATKKDQAALPWKDARALVHASPALSRRIRGHEQKATVYQLYDPTTSSFLKPLSNEAGGEEGINPHLVIIDELHRAKDRTLNDMLVHSSGARSQPMLGQITTAGEIGESIWAEEHDYATSVVEGTVDDDEMLVLIYMLDPDDDPFDESVWPKSNPNLGVSVNIEEMRARAREARAEPRRLNSFLRLRMNRRAQNESSFMPMDHWAKCGDEPEITDGDTVFGGLDIGWSRDLTAFVLWVPNDDGKFSLRPLFWMPEESAELRRTRDRIPYDVWAREGWLTLTEGNVRDDDAIEAGILAAVEPLEVRVVKYDRAMSTNLVNRLARAGLLMEPLGQGIFTLSAPTKELERLVVSHRIRHGNHPVLTWMAGNAATKEDDNGNIRIAKPHGNSPLKVDGISATVDAIAGWLEVQDEEEGPSVWEQEGRSLLL